jgi:hypothetical protein
MKKIIIFLITVLLIWVLLQLYEAILNEYDNNVVLPYYDNTQHEPVKRKMLLIINI